MGLAEIPLSVWRTRGHDFEFQGQVIRYWSAGQGEPLLLLHGFPTASWDWNYLWQPLSRQYRVIACDMLGFGDSAKPRDHDYSLLEQADLQQALLDHLGVNQPVHVLAHEYGGNVAQELLARDGEGLFKMASCVFLNGVLFPETHRLRRVHKWLLGPLGWLVARLFDRASLDKGFSRIFGPDTRPSESELDDFWSLITSNGGQRILNRLITYIPERMAQRDRWVQAMQQTSLPMRLINGVADPYVGTRTADRYRELIPAADAVLIPGIGRYPHTESPALLLRHYQRFRADIAERRTCLVPPRPVQNAPQPDHPVALSSTIQSASC